MYFLLAINLLLSLLAIFLFLILYKKTSTIQRLEVEYKELLKEAEDTISSYVYELKEENDKFLQSINRTNKNNSNPQESTVHEIDIVEEPLGMEDLEEILKNNHIEETKPIELETNQLNVEKTPYELAMDLHESGISSEEIARKLNLGKTEVELLLKIRQ